MTHHPQAFRVVSFILLVILGNLVFVSPAPWGASAPRQLGYLPPQLPLLQPKIRLLKQSPGNLECEVTFPEILVDTTACGCNLTMGTLPQRPDFQGYLLPVFGTILPGASRTFRVTVLEAITARVHLLQAPAICDQDQINTTSADEVSTPSSRRIQQPKNRSTTPNWISIRELGESRRLPVSLLEFAPVRLELPSREAIYLRSLKFRLEFEATGSLTASPKNSLPETLPGLTNSLPLPRRTSHQPPALVSNSVLQTRLKIFVSQEGLYHLNSETLQSWGVNLSGADPRTFRLENRGQEQPLYVAGEADGRFDEEDYLEFWGEGLHETFTQINPEIYSDLYTDVNVYWLSWGGPLGARLTEESGEIVEMEETQMFRANSYPFFWHQEQNSYFNRLSQVVLDSLKDHWYFDNGVQAGQTHNYTLYLPYPDTNALFNASLKVALQGLTYPDVNNQGGHHHAFASLNDVTNSALIAGSAGASWWVGQTGVILSAAGSQGIGAPYLHHGNNQFSITVLMDTDSGPNDTVLLNWFEITYNRLYRADADLIRFAPPQGAVDTLVDYRIDNFTTSQIDVFKLGQSKVINGEVVPYQNGNQTLYELHFQDRPFGQPQYVALAPSAKLPPDSAQLDLGSDVYGTLSSGGPIKLLVIAHRTFENHPDLENYLDRRNANLGRTELVFIDDVFDEYNEGIYNPQALKDLLLSLPTPPEYLLLIGDASYDTRNTYGEGGNLVPAFYLQTTAYGSVASDFWYSLLDEDYIPDLAVGRIPCREAQELTDFLHKLEEYEINPEPGVWRNTHLFVSGTGGVPEITFLGMSQQILGSVPPHVWVERLATDPYTSPFYGGTVDLIDLFDAGTLIIDYNGHGAGAVWSDNSLFRIENLPQLDNQGRYPFITNFTCFIGAFDTPQQGSILGEEFIFEPEKGGISVLASTGLGWFQNGSWLQEQLVQQVYAQPELALGDLVNAAKMLYFALYGQAPYSENPKPYDTILLMNLLGDPSLKLAFATPGTSPQINAPPYVEYGDSINISLPGVSGGDEGILRIYENHTYPALEFGQIYEEPLLSSGGDLHTGFYFPTLSDTSEPTSGTYRITYWDPSSDSTYYSTAMFYLQDAYATTVVDSFDPYPNPVYVDDAFGFKAKILDTTGIASAYLHFQIITQDTLYLVVDDSLVMNPLGQPFWYQCAPAIDSSVYHYNVGDEFTAWIKAIDTQGDTFITVHPMFDFQDSRPDPSWVDGSLQIGARNNQAALIIEAQNSGQTAVDSMDLAFYRLTPSTTFLGSVIIRDLAPDSSQEAYLPISILDPDTTQFQVIMNGNGWVNDMNPTPPYEAYLPVDHFTVTLQQGTGDTLELRDGVFQVYLPEGSLSQSSGVLTLRERTDLELPPTQEGVFFILQDSAGVIPGWGFELGLLGNLALTGDSLYFATELTSYQAQPGSEVALHVQEDGQPFWQLLNTAAQTLASSPNIITRYTTKTASLGAFTLLQNSDHQGPTIEITVEGQIYTPGGNVPSHPKISAMVQDLGGVNATPGSFWITIDGATVDSAEISVNLENGGQVLALSVNPNFSTGQHSLSVSASDLAGNSGTSTITFQVTGHFDLEFLGNYPNPMDDKTYFSYSLTEQTTEPVRINIFTVSGRQIRTLYSNSAEEINYGEIYWDGRDEQSENIANGVYFYKFFARRGDHKIERTMKLAKIRKEQ